MNNNNNPFGLVIPTDDDLINAQPQNKREILDEGIYYAFLVGMEFKRSKSNLPMIVVDFNIVQENSQAVVNIKDYWMLASSKPEYKPSIFGKLAGLFACWNVPKENRGIKYFTWIPQQEGEDPAERLMKCIHNYSSVAKTNTSYISKKMVRLSIDKVANTYTDNSGALQEGFNNSVTAFIPLEDISTTATNINNNNVVIDNSYSNKNENATNNNNDDPFKDFM